MIIFIHDDFKEDETMMELYALECVVKVEQEGPSDFFFEAVGWEMMQTQWVIQQHRKFFQVNCDEVHGTGLEVDDDNLPTPENIPTPN